MYCICQESQNYNGCVIVYECCQAGRRLVQRVMAYFQCVILLFYHRRHIFNALYNNENTISLFF
ncbi:hypothetical protein Hanom_Chr01g00033071 [Helianthus anomalus]